MKITIEPTEQMVEVNGVPARVWNGVSESGVPCFVLVTRVAVRSDHDNAEFEAALREVKGPSLEARLVFPLRMFLE